MKKLNMIAILCGLFVTGLANAECPSSLDKTEMMKCQEVEKSGSNYQEWKKEMANKSTTSPITGKDVKDIKPAAGKAMSDSKTDK